MPRAGRAPWRATTRRCPRLAPPCRCRSDRSRRRSRPARPAGARAGIPPRGSARASSLSPRMESTGHLICGASAIVSGTVAMRSRKLSALITYHQPGMSISSRPRPAFTSSVARACISSTRSMANSPLRAAAADPGAAAAPRRKQHQRRRPRMIDDVPHAEHAAVAVADHDRVPEIRAPRATRAAMRLSAIASRVDWKAPPSAIAAVARAEDVVPAAVEREAGEPEPRQHRRQEARRADVEIHRVAVKQQHRPGCVSRVGLVESSVEGNGVGGDGDELRPHVRKIP